MEKVKSATDSLVILIGSIALIGFLFLSRLFTIENKFYICLMIMMVTVLVHSLLDLFYIKVHKRASTGLQWGKEGKKINYSAKRTLIKLYGLFVTLSLIAIMYWVFPEYAGDFYQNYWLLLKTILPIWGLLAIPYFYFIDARQVDPYDNYYILGAFFLGKSNTLELNKMKQHFLGWIIKAFFLPLMFTYFVRDYELFLNTNLSGLSTFKDYFDFIYNFIFLIDVGVVSVGYLMSLKILDSHLRSAEPTMQGWFVALLCYQPFWSLFEKQYISYSSDFGWGAWLENSPTLYMIWGSAILILFFIYVWSSLMFGIRFSNLTHRGIITNGPYRWVKHPAYISKNIAWWLIAVPFIISQSFADSLRRCLLLMLLNIIYYLRARTEERHLSADKTYQDYQQMISQQGLFSRF